MEPPKDPVLSYSRLGNFQERDPGILIARARALALSVGPNLACLAHHAVPSGIIMAGALEFGHLEVPVG